jgi:glycosyltransferase involved in cell wall biosynthesis
MKPHILYGSLLSQSPAAMTLKLNRPSLYDRLCAGPKDGSLPPYFHVPLQQYALSGVETDRILTEAEQEMWRRTVMLGYAINKRNDTFFTDPFIPSFFSPQLVDWLNFEERRSEGLPVTRFMKMLNTHISPYDNLYDLDNPRSVRRFLTDMVVVFDILSGLPSPLQPQEIFDYLSADADGLPRPEGQSFPLSRGLAFVWRYLLMRVPFEPASQAHRADFLIKFFKLFEAVHLDKRLIPPSLIAYLNATRYPTLKPDVGVTNLMVEIFRLAGISDGQNWNDPVFAQAMVEQFFKEAYPTLLIPDVIAAGHDSMALALGIQPRRQTMDHLQFDRAKQRFVWKRPKPVPCDPSLAQVNIIAFDDSANQMSRLTGRLIRMASASGLHHVSVASLQELQRRKLVRENIAEEVPVAPINLFACPLERLGDFILRRGIDVFEDRYNIAYASWGTDRLPETCKVALDLLDEIWVPSVAQQKIFQKETTLPVHVVPAPINLQAPAETISRKHLDLPEERFLFLTVFDVMDWMSRKNPIAVIEAFQKAFPGKENVGLIVKTRNISRLFSTREQGHLNRMQKLWRKDIRILTIHDEFTEGEMSGLINLADAYVTLPRATAFDSTLAEAIAWGKPVVTTAGGGHADYVSSATAQLVESVPCSVVFDAYHFLDKEVGHRWSDPDVETAAAGMRAIYADRKTALAKAAEGQKQVRARYNDQACGPRMRARIEAILAGILAEKAA